MDFNEHVELALQLLRLDLFSARDEAETQHVAGQDRHGNGAHDAEANAHREEANFDGVGSVDARRSRVVGNPRALGAILARRHLNRVRRSIELHVVPSHEAGAHPPGVVFEAGIANAQLALVALPNLDEVVSAEPLVPIAVDVEAHVLQKVNLRAVHNRAVDRVLVVTQRVLQNVLLEELVVVGGRVDALAPGRKSDFRVCESIDVVVLVAKLESRQVCLPVVGV